jgi:Putative Flp pilus-assembly TadE/G-like
MRQFGNRRHSERGQVVVFFALLLPMLLALSGMVVGVGNWYVHAKHLQTKADAGALGGGSAWSFPCSTDASNNIVNNARFYAGPSAVTANGANPQVGGVPKSNVHTVLNGSDYYDDDSNPAPTEFNSPSGSVCDNRILDVKMTEDNSFPLASLIPLFPDIKRHARVQIEEGNGASGLLPIAVRVPKPLSAAAIYVNEDPNSPNYKKVLDARYFNDVCEPPNFTGCLSPMPSGLDQWTTDDGAGGNRGDIAAMPSQVGVVVGLSFRPQCPGANPCFNIDYTNAALDTIDEMCNQGTSALVQCFYATGNSTQTFQSGLQFIRGYSPNPSPGDPEPDLLDVWFDTASGTNCYQGYFSAPVANSCNVLLHANIDPGFGGAGSYEIRYKLVSGNTAWQEDDAPGPCNNSFGAQCQMVGGVANVTLDPQYARHAVGIAIYRYNLPHAVVVANNLPAACEQPGAQAQCVWYFPDNGGALRGRNNPPTTNQGNAYIFTRPVQRAFMGDIDKSGSVKFLHLYNVDCTTGAVLAGTVETGLAASVQTGHRCFKMEMGLQGALARDQDEEPIVLNIGTTSQSAVVDCDPNAPNLKSEIQNGCSLTFKKNDFTFPGPNGNYCPGGNMPQFYTNPQPPWDTRWPPYDCVITQTTAAASQIVQGFDLRFFGVSNNPSCPADNAAFVPGRNYWHDANNNFTSDPDGAGPEPPQADYYTFATTRAGRPVLPHGNHLRNDDPRFVLLFITPYNSFTGNGNERFPITAIGGFYITGYGELRGNGQWQGGAPEDPCTTGNGQGIGAGNTPPPDLNMNNNGAVAWGHFVVPVDLGTSQGGTGVLCQPSSLMACVPVLVQ